VPLPEIAPREDARPAEPERRQDEIKAPLMGLFGFSVIGLLLCLILTRMPVSRNYLPLEILLIFVAGPLAAWLGFSLGGHD
jgi:hypothetical protein